MKLSCITVMDATVRLGGTWAPSPRAHDPRAHEPSDGMGPMALGWWEVGMLPPSSLKGYSFGATPGTKTRPKSQACT